jgi:uncharacterized protein YukE
MKAILLACKGITEECETLQDNTEVSDDDYDSIRDAKDILSDELTNLMSVAKQHASSASSSSTASIEERLKKLSYAVSDMVENIKLVTSHLGPSGDVKTPDTIKDTATLAFKSPKSDGPLPMDMTDLRYYLEDNTDDIAHTIQDLLQAMRNSATPPTALQKLLGTVQTIVDNIIYETKLTLSESGTSPNLRADCKVVLELLEDDREKLITMAKDVTKDRSVKQQIANSSYEIAKHAKELLSIIDD